MDTDTAVILLSKSCEHLALNAPVCCGRKAVLMVALTIICKTPVYGCVACRLQVKVPLKGVG